MSEVQHDSETLAEGQGPDDIEYQIVRKAFKMLGDK